MVYMIAVLYVYSYVNITSCAYIHIFAVSHSIFEEDLGGFPSAENPFIFNGDNMVDRGRYGFEIVMSLLAIKLADPSAVHILRGNHETELMYHRYGFYDEILWKYDEEVFSKFQQLFQGFRY